MSLRIIAALLLAAALVPHDATRHDRVLVVALDGVRLAKIRELVDRGAMPNVATLLDQSVRAALYGGSRRDPRSFWRSAFSAAESTTGDEHYVWDWLTDSGLRASTVAVPETRERISGTALILPGADEMEGFIGDNAGRVVDVEALDRSGLRWPYEAAAEPALAAMRALAPKDASDWIRVRLPAPDGRRGAFRIYRLDDTTAYLSPVYRSAESAQRWVPALDGRLIYVPDDPAWTVDSSRLRDYFYRHVRDLTEARAQVATDLAAGRWPLLVYYDSLLGLVDQAYLDQPRKQGDVTRDAYEIVDRRIGALVAASGQRTAVVLVGREPPSAERTQAARSTSTGFLLVADGAGIRSHSTADSAHVTRVGGTLLYLLGVRTPEESPPIEAVVARFPGANAAAAESPERSTAARGVPFTAASLRRLGLLSELTQAPAALNGDASAATSVTTD